MRKFFLPLFLCVLVSCVGQKEDPEEDVPGTEVTVGDASGIVLDFTATWCVNCPRMTTAIEEAAAERALIPICVHFQDDMVCDDGKALINHFGVQVYPSAVMNMDPATLITATSKEIILARLDAASSGKAPCLLDASLNADGVVSVSVTAADDGVYTISAALLEDGIVAPQTGASDSYVHNSVFRGFLQEDLLGDSLGQLSKGESVQRDFPAGQALGEKHRVAVFVCHNGIVNSATVVKL